MGLLTEDQEVWYERILDEAREVRRRKRKDYSQIYLDPDGEGTFSICGWEGIVPRLYDKLRRLDGFALQNLIEGTAEAANVPIRDAFVDMINYAAFGLHAYDEGISWRKDLRGKARGRGGGNVPPSAEVPLTARDGEASARPTAPVEIIALTCPNCGWQEVAKGSDLDVNEFEDLKTRLSRHTCKMNTR